VLVDDTMIVTIEIFRSQQVGDLVQRLIFQQQAAKTDCSASTEWGGILRDA